MAKNLKKLSFAKEELVNLNEYEMSHIKGGEQSSPGCAALISQVVTAVTAIGAVTYPLTKDASWWYCATPDCNCGNGGGDERPQDFQIEEPASTYILEDGSCLLNAITVRPSKR